MAIKSLNEIIKFNNSFKTSINLYLSLNRAEKVLSYIPTKSSVNFLDGYMQATINNKEQATLLVGPYGKGKSHLLLVLLAILSMERTGENTQIIEELADKISAVDELGEQAASDVKLLWSKNRFLPVIINDTTGDLNQAFLLALNDALKREKLVDLAPDTYYSIALNRIEDWQENYPETYHDFITELKSIGIEHKEFIYELKRYSRTALDTFISVYPKITSGSIFNPLAVSEVLPLYKSVSERLVEDYGFSGIYIVFDEFSKFIEGLTDGNVGNNMKLLQDMCELATDSSNAKIFITMIAHKSMIDENNSSFAIRIEHLHYNTKKREEATELYYIDKEAEEGVRIIHDVKNPNDTHKYNAKFCIKEINKRIEKAGIELRYNNAVVKFNQYHFQLFTNYFGIKENDRFCFIYEVSTQPQYSYSQQAIDFIFNEIKKAPDTIIGDLKDKIKKSTPGAKDSK